MAQSRRCAAIVPQSDSAFIGEMEPRHKRALIGKLKKWLGEEEGNVQVFPICDQDIKKREIIINPAAGDDE